jgi:hypothetical protein
MQAESTHFYARSSNSPPASETCCKLQEESCIYAVLKGACAGSSPAAGTDS